MKAEVLRPGLRAVSHNWRPFILIQAFAVGLAMLYYASPAFQVWAGSLANLKTQGGYLAAFVANAFAGAVLPEVAKRLTMKSKPTHVAEMAFQLAFFGVLGMYVDLLYRTQSLLFGNAVTLSVVAVKVCFDMFVSSPFVAAPFSTAAFQWKDQGFSFRRSYERFRQGSFSERYWPLLISCWCFWIPILFAVYAMPKDLQFCLFLCVQAAWSLVLLHMSGRE